MKLRPLLILVGAAGAAAVVIKRRGGVEVPHASYAPPAEALAQEPAEPGGPPSAAAPVTQSTRIVSEPGEQLNVPEHGAPEGAVMPDTSSDPLVDSQTAAAMGDAGSIGGNDEVEEASDAGEEAEGTHRDG